MPVSRRVGKRRVASRAAGSRSTQTWPLDTRRPGFEEECRRQSGAVALADATDGDLGAILDAVLADEAGA